MDRRRSVFAASLSVLFVLIALSMLASANALIVAVGIVTLPFFGTCSLTLAVAAIRPPLVLAMDDRGVRFGGLLPSWRHEVPWGEIRGVRIFRFEAAPLGSGMRMLGFIPARPASPVWRRRFTRMNRRVSGVPASISANTIGVELEQIVEQMRRFHPQLEFEYGEGIAAGLGKLTRPSQWGRRQ